MAQRHIIIVVIGSSTCPQEISQIAYEVGKGIAQKGGILICGGLGGVMEAASQGAKEAGGLTIGLLPGIEKKEANPYIDIPIVTGLSIARNAILVRSSDAIIAVSGGYGTLSEIAFALQLQIPVVELLSWKLGMPIIEANTALEAVEIAF